MHALIICLSQYVTREDVTRVAREARVSQDSFR